VCGHEQKASDEFVSRSEANPKSLVDQSSSRARRRIVASAGV